MEMNRRVFLGSSALFAASTAVGAEKEKKAPAADGAAEPFRPSEPVLQAPGETSMGVVWRVNKLAHGEVEVSETPDFKNPVLYRSGTGLGLAQLDEEALQVRLTGLKPATRYWYRTRSTPYLYYKNAYDLKLGETVTSASYSFMTLGSKAAAHFAVMNDTHMRWPVFAKVVQKLQALKPSVAIWNGDATNTTETKATALDAFVTPPVPQKAWSAELPVLFNSGNHDFRGRFMSRLDEVVLDRLPGERTPEFWPLTRNFALRLGDLALIGLDTGEDKPDAHPKWAGVANFSPHRKLQAAWLERQFERPEIAEAPFVVVFCHIPIYCPKDSPTYPHDGVAIDPNDFAHWSRECGELWGPLLEKHRVQLLVTAHQHRYRFDAPAEGRSWAQITGGGCNIPVGDQAPGEFPTVIEGRVEDGALKITTHNLRTGKVQAVQTFKPRA